MVNITTMLQFHRTLNSSVFGSKWIVTYCVLSIAIKIGTALFSDRFGFDADEASLALMAKHTSEGGGFLWFTYGQKAGGALEYLTTTFLFSFLPHSLCSLRLAAGLLMLIAEVCLLKALINEGFKPRSVFVGMLAFLVSSQFFFNFTAHIYGTHLNNIVVFAALIYLLSALDVRKTGIKVFGIGLCLGIGFWNSNAIALIAMSSIPFCLTLRRFHFNKIASYAPLILAGFIIGASPRCIFYLFSPTWYAPYDAGTFAFASTSVWLPRLNLLFSDTMPRYLVGDVVTFSKSFGFLALLFSFFPPGVALLTMKSSVKETIRTHRLLVATSLLFLTSVLVMVLNKFTYDSGIRYLWPWQFVIAAGIATVCDKTWLVTKTGKAMFLLMPVLIGTVSIFAWFAKGGDRWEVEQTNEVISFLEQRHCTHGYGDYWMAYNIAFKSNEQIIVEPFFTSRIAEYRNAVKMADTNLFYIFRRIGYSAPLSQQFYQKVSQEVATRGNELALFELGPDVIGIETNKNKIKQERVTCKKVQRK